MESTLSSYLFQSHCHTPYCVVMRSPLKSGKHGVVDPRLEVVEDGLSRLVLALLSPSVEDQPGPDAPEALVGGGRHDVRVVEGGGDHVGRHQPRDVSHVRQQY